MFGLIKMLLNLSSWFSSLFLMWQLENVKSHQSRASYSYWRRCCAATVAAGHPLQPEAVQRAVPGQCAPATLFLSCRPRCGSRPGLPSHAAFPNLPGTPRTIKWCSEFTTEVPFGYK